MSTNQWSRTLAADLRVRRFGYAVLETPHRLLDYGISQFDTTRTVRRRIRALLNRYRPSVVVLDSGPTCGPHDKRRTASVTRAIRAVSRTKSIPVTVLPAEVIREFFHQYGLRNKYSSAALLATWFPELTERVPAERECYDPEPWIMAWLDAISIGTAYLARSNQQSAEFFRRSLGDE